MNKTTKTCKQCGGSYIPCRPTQSFCSSQCFGAHNTETRRKRFTCGQCKRVFLDNGGTNRYCSYECHQQAQREPIEVICEHCKKPFTVNRYRLEHYNTKFCSNACRYGSRWLTFNCYGCKKEMRMLRCHFEARSTKNADGHIFCSLDCLGLWQRGEGHPNWQGGHRKWRGPNWIIQKDLARERDNYTCQECGIDEKQLGRPLDVHHKIPWRKFKNDWKQANDLSNLISLCPKCHTTIEAKHHRRPPRTRTTQQVQT